MSFLCITSFKRLIDGADITVHHTLLYELVKFWSMGGECFSLHNLMVMFTTRNVALILGLEDKRDKLEGGLWINLFPANDEVTRVSLKNKIHLLTDSHDVEDMLDTARMVIVHFLYSFLLAMGN